MRRIGRLVVVGLGASLFLASAPAAQADLDRVLSEPNGDLSVTSDSGATSDHDRDGDYTTLTQADKGGLFRAVFNLSPTAQTVHLTVVLDGPGTVQDAVLLDDDFHLDPGESEQGTTDIMIRRKDWPEGTYSLSVTASGTESATAVSTFTVAY